MRIDRIDEDIKYFLNKIITEELKDPKIQGIVTITGVDTSKDLKYAKVYVSVYGTKYPHKIFAKIKSASGYIKKCLSGMLKARSTPELEFVYDDSMEYGAHMDEIFKKMDKK